MSHSIVFLVLVLFAVSTQSTSRLDAVKAKLDSVKACTPGYLGATEDVLSAVRKCDAMNIKDTNCYVACRLREQGIIKDKFDDVGAKSFIAKVWDSTPAAQEAGDKEFKESMACAKKYEAEGGKWPTPPYTDNCKEMETVAKCVVGPEECKKTG